jgi:hypothetical protein
MHENAGRFCVRACVRVCVRARAHMTHILQPLSCILFNPWETFYLQEEVIHSLLELLEITVYSQQLWSHRRPNHPELSIFAEIILCAVNSIRRART